MRHIAQHFVERPTRGIVCDVSSMAYRCRPFSTDVEDARMSPLALSVRVEHWPIAGSFAISRGAKTEAVVVVAELSDGRRKRRGECVPYARYDESVATVTEALAAMRELLARGLDRAALQQAMPAGAARNALDC